MALQSYRKHLVASNSPRVVNVLCAVLYARVCLLRNRCLSMCGFRVTSRWKNNLEFAPLSTPYLCEFSSMIQHFYLPTSCQYEGSFELTAIMGAVECYYSSRILSGDTFWSVHRPD